MIGNKETAPWRTEMATIDLLATIVVIAVPSDAGSEIRNSCLLPSSKSPVESLTIKRGQALGAIGRED
jgi:hypothetical protein